MNRMTSKKIPKNFRNFLIFFTQMVLNGIIHLKATIYLNYLIIG